MQDGSRIEAEWKKARSRMEAERKQNGKQNGSRIEVEWKQNGTRMEAEWKQI